MIRTRDSAWINDSATVVAQPGVGVEMVIVDQLHLSSSITVARYRTLVAREDRQRLAQFIEERLLERYVRPIEATPPDRKNGFLTMASACLLIETLESFYQGWEDNHKPVQRSLINSSCRPSDPKKSNVSRSEVAFCYFFSREEAFISFRPLAEEFYRGVRCGILHQGETTGGWLVKRAGPLVVTAARTINATRFLQCVSHAVESYKAHLEVATWDDTIWVNYRKKMQAILANCEPPR